MLLMRATQKTPLCFVLLVVVLLPCLPHRLFQRRCPRIRSCPIVRLTVDHQGSRTSHALTYIQARARGQGARVSAATLGFGGINYILPKKFWVSRSVIPILYEILVYQYELWYRYGLSWRTRCGYYDAYSPFKMKDNDIEASETEALVGAIPHTVASPPSASKPCRRRIVFCIAAAAALGWLAKLAGTQRWVVRLSEPSGLSLPSHTVAWFRQDRPIQRLGLTDAYEEINKGPTIDKRIEDMRLLDQIRFGYCDHFEDFLAGDNTTHWTKSTSIGKSNHCLNGESYRTEIGCQHTLVSRYVCEAEHPTMEGVTVTIERYGRFSGKGGYDWTSVRAEGSLEEATKGRDVAFVGGMAAPVYANGTLVAYPPLHIHHAHVFPYGDMDERSQKINGSIVDHHDILFQSHGDTECHAEEGGIACLLNVLDPGMVRVMEKSDSGLSVDFEINDVRPEGSDELFYWFEIVLMHTEYDERNMQRSTFVGLNNQCVGAGPCTYVIPFDPNANLLAYSYTHGDFGSNLSSGFMSNFILHTHQTIMDSVFLFLAHDNSVLEIVDSLRQDRDYPLILDCLDDPGVYDIEAAKQELLLKIMSSGAQLVCEATRPSLLLKTDSAGNTHAYDKRAQLNCLQGRVPLDAGDVLTVLAFNEIRPHNVTRSSQAFRKQTPFSNSFVVHQHSIFRFDLSHGDVEPPYVPPSYFYYSDHGVLNPNFTKPLDVMIHTGCSDDSIRFGF